MRYVSLPIVPYLRWSIRCLRIKCRMPWRSGIQYATHNGSKRLQLSIISLLMTRTTSLLINLLSDQILFLNKNDLFDRKILTSNIKSFFPVSLSFPWGFDHERVVYDKADSDEIEIRISTANQEMREPVGNTSNDVSRSSHKNLVVLRSERFIFSKSVYLGWTNAYWFMVEKHHDSDGYSYAPGGHGCSWR